MKAIGEPLKISYLTAGLFAGAMGLWLLSYVIVWSFIA
jgi:hypothetical protein